ncbi:MAG TPA: protein kinase [Polyangia bacterium]|jgi:tetratricopeptide (TPR) repeat protein|nr:protein kinase [Polyangia bacterium]
MDPWMMGPGTVVADRFEIESLARTGGMGLIFRARDRHTRLSVALKVLKPSGSVQDTERFLREAEVLSELHHPAIAAYIAHGRTPDGLIYLAMEWLHGEDLSQRLAHQPLTVSESLGLIRAAAEALAVVHGYGIVHRDIKPSNLLLRDGLIDQVTLLDFGIARGGLASWSVTRTGEVVGTLHYIAPEQARGERQLGPSVDVYALGCVLFECLTGSPPFDGEHVAVLLARILCQEAPPLRQLRPDLPEELEKLLAQMLAKTPEARLANGSALRVALSGLMLPAETQMTPQAPEPTPLLAGGEQRLVSIIVALPLVRTGEETVTMALTDETTGEEQQRILRELLAPYGAKVDHLASGAIVATLVHEGHMATDQALQAARATLALKAYLSGAAATVDAAVALATGRGMLSEQLPVGEAIERAVHLVQLATALPEEQRSPHPWIDELTAGLLENRFIVRRAAQGLYAIEGERPNLDETRRLLGRPTPYVGREQELQLLEMLVNASIEDSAARTVLVLAPPGMGKSRLRLEFLRQLRAEHPEVVVLTGRSDPMHAGLAYGLIGDALRRYYGLGQGSEASAHQAQFAEGAGRHLTPAQRQQTVPFLGELCGIPFSDEKNPQLRAARQEPRIMSDRITDAFVLWLGAECAAHPVVLVLEDLHWGDPATVRLVDAALRDLADRPLLVLALGRPEIKELFPRLWEDRNVQEVRLPELGRKASERLAQAVLGAKATPQVVARITEQAAGNALFLEELIRSVAEDQGEELPETVLAMLQARFLRMETGARRLLRAASIFGETFWRGGLLELLGMERRTENDIDRWLALLTEGETIVRQRESRFPGEVQYAFRHSLLREAAYSLLTEADRRTGHRLAGAYLERMGESDPLSLAEHYLRGGELRRAAPLFARAAARALETNDLQGALRHADQGIISGASGETLAQLRGIEAWAHFWCGEIPAAYAAAQAAVTLLPPGTIEWCRAMGMVLISAGFLSNHERLQAGIQELASVSLVRGAEASFIEPAMAAAVISLSHAGRPREAVPLLERMLAESAALGENEARTIGALQLACTTHLFLAGTDPWAALLAARASVEGYQAAGDQRMRATARGHVAAALGQLGDEETAIQEFQAAITQLTQTRGQVMLSGMQARFAGLLADRGEPRCFDEILRLVEEVAANNRYGSMGSTLVQAALAQIHMAREEWREAEEAVRKACAGSPACRLLTYALLARVLLAQGRTEEARGVVDQGMVTLVVLGEHYWMDVKLLGVTAEVRHAAGDREGARQAILGAVERIRARAARIPEEAMREKYLTQVRDNAHAFELARRWLEPGPG